MATLSDSLQSTADGTAIGLSLLCAAHCLLLPIAVALSPSIAALGIDDASFHLWMVFGVVPISVVALAIGCKRHRRSSILAIGIVGLVVLGLTPVLGQDALGEAGEKAMTLFGAGLIALSHLLNFRACQRARDCACTGSDHVAQQTARS
jgi:hypothetical protein